MKPFSARFSADRAAVSIFDRFFAALRALLMTAGGLVLLVTFTPLVPWTASCLTDNWTESDGEVMIVPSGSTVQHALYAEERMIGESSYWRVVHAVWAWQQGHFRSIVLTGQGAGEMKRFLLAYGVPADAIWVESQSTSTRGNALMVKPLLDRLPRGRNVLLTSDYHMYRAARCFRRAGIAVITRPFPDILKSSNTLTARWRGFWLLAD